MHRLLKQGLQSEDIDRASQTITRLQYLFNLDRLAGEIQKNLKSKDDFSKLWVKKKIPSCF